MLTTHAVELLERVIVAIEREPHRIDMDHWIHSDSCGTTGCIAGWAASLGYRMPFEQLLTVRVRVGAQELLQLSDDETQRLFSIHDWPEQFCMIVDDKRVIRGNFKPGTPEYAAVVVARIRFFIATDGTDNIHHVTTREEVLYRLLPPEVEPEPVVTEELELTAA